MNQSNFDTIITIPRVNKKGVITGHIERWEAHRNGILHKAFSVVLLFRNQFILQIRKHRVFDCVIDVTASSHPEIAQGGVEHEEKAILRCLKREWHINSEEIHTLKSVGSIYYKSPDSRSEFIEHEYCTFYTAHVDKMIFPNYEFAYGYVLINKDYFKKNSQSLRFAPWVEKAFQKKLL